MASVVLERSRVDRLRQVLDQEVQAIARAMEPVLRPLQGETLLVTGGAGFVCSYFVETIAHLNRAWAQPCRVICVDNLITGQAGRLAHLLNRPDIRFIEHDLSKPLSLKEPVKWMIHGAGIASPSTYRKHPLETIAVNVHGTEQVLELTKAHQARSVVYLSSSEIYGDPPAEWIPTPEDYRGSVSCTGPRACYDESKRLAETLCMAYHRCFSLPVSIVRPFNIYGPGQRLDDGRVVPDLVSAALRREPLVLFSNGRATRAFCYIRDAVCAIWHVLMAEGHGAIYNVGNDQEEVSMQALAERVQEAAGPPFLAIEQRRNQDPEYLTDNPNRRCPNLTKLRTAFSWAPSVSLLDGLRMTLDAHRPETVV